MCVSRNTSQSFSLDQKNFSNPIRFSLKKNGKYIINCNQSLIIHFNMSAIIEYTIFVAVPLLLIIYIWKTWKFYLASFKIKGPVPLPILGNCLEFLGSSKGQHNCRFNSKIVPIHFKSCFNFPCLDIFQNIARLIEKTSGTPIRVWIGPYFIVITADPGDFKILLNHSDSTTKSKFYKFVADAVTGDGILTQKDGITCLKSVTLTLSDIM